QARVLYELAHAGELTATALGKDLALDLGYLSRLLAELRQRGLLHSKKSARDGRQSLLSLSDKGRKAFAQLNARSREEMAAMLATLPAEGHGRLVGAMSTIRDLLDSG